MRMFNPIHLVAAVAIALSGANALAQTTGGTPRVAPAGAATTTGPTMTTGAATPAASPSTGGCAGTGGSTCTANTNSTPESTTATSPSRTPTPGVRADSSAGSQSTLQETPGQSAGGSGSAMGANQTTVDPATTRPGMLNGTTGAVILPGDAAFAGNPSQQTIVIQQQPAAQPEVKSFSAPLLDQTTREAQKRETRRRNAKQEPRIIGIAPNTDRDLTYQMPDDRIIRY